MYVSVRNVALGLVALLIHVGCVGFDDVPIHGDEPDADGAMMIPAIGDMGLVDGVTNPPRPAPYDYQLLSTSNVPVHIQDDDAPLVAYIHVRNTGAMAWEPADNIRLRATVANQFLFGPPGPAVDCDAPTDCAVAIPARVEPGQDVQFRIELTPALDLPRTQRLLRLSFVMSQDEGAFFGEVADWNLGRCIQGMCPEVPVVMPDEPDMRSDDMEQSGDVDMGEPDAMDMGAPEPDMSDELDMTAPSLDMSEPADMSSAPEDMTEPLADMGPPPTYCRVDPSIGLNLRACSGAGEPSTVNCPTIIDVLSGGAYVEQLEEHPNTWQRVRDLGTDQVGWVAGMYLDCGVELPTDTCPPPTTTSQRVAACSSTLLYAQTRPLDALDPLYYVNRWYSIDRCFPSPASSSTDAAIDPYVEPALKNTCGTYSPVAVNLVNVPVQYSSGSRQLRQLAWESPAPANPAQTYDGSTVGYQGKIGFKAMFDAAFAEQGYAFIVISGFRSASTQYSLFNNYVQREGGDPDRASVYSAKPTHSEHQLGTTADVTYLSNGAQVNPYAAPYDFDISPQGRWLVENSHRFGIVTTYEPHKIEVHQYQPEPWHMRFVGVEAADVMKQCDLNTEELLAYRYQIPSPLPMFSGMPLVYQRMSSLGYPQCLNP